MSIFGEWIRKHKFWSIFLGLALLGVVYGSWMYLQEEDLLSQIESEKISRETVTQVVSETGVVEPAEDANLSFSSSGQIVSVLAEEGDEVEAGEVIARLESSGLEASVAQAQAALSQAEARLQEMRNGVRSEQRNVNQANVQSAQVRVETAEQNLEQVKTTQDELVRDARESLYTSNLQAYLTDGERETNQNYTPPTISGTLDMLETGEYVVNLYSSSADSGWSFTYTGFGETGTRTVSTSQPKALGSRGLFIQFPQNFGRSRDVEWTIPVPNTRSSQYVVLKNALEQARDTRESAVLQAENSLRDAEVALEQARAQAGLSNAPAREEQMQSQEASVAAARASVAQARSNLSDKVLRAPFSGSVTEMLLSEGELAQAGQSLTTLISDEPFQISVNIPEVDTARLDVGDSAEIVFDAYEDEVFLGQVKQIATTARSVEGVRSVEVTVAFDDADARIKTGLSADVDIIAATEENVFAVPSRAIQRIDGETFVYRYVSDSDGGGVLNRVNVTTGLRGSDGLTVVTSGLEANQEIVTFLNEETRTRLISQGLIQ